MLYYASFDTAEALRIRDNVMIIVTPVAPGAWFELTAIYLTITCGIELLVLVQYFLGSSFIQGGKAN